MAPDDETVMVVHNDREPLPLTGDQVLDGGGILPGFRLPVSEIFAL